MTSPAPLLVAESFSLSVAGRELLVDTSFSVREGELLLLVGPSGAGKSLLIQVLASVLRPGENELAASGTLTLHGVDLLGPREGGRARVGLVFQDHALFDDLTAAENLEFALDHSPTEQDSHKTSSDARRARVAALLDEFGIAGMPHVRAMSGGQKQRLALARTLAQDPELILYDEPTTGLDPRNARRVADRIRDTHRQHGKTSIVITHDHSALAAVADRILLLDPVQKLIREVGRESIDRELLELTPPKATAPDQPSGPSRIAAFFSSTGEVFVAACRAMGSLVPRWPVARWGLRAARHQLHLVAGPSALLYMATAGVILGLVATHFTFRYLPMKHYTEPLLIDEILSGLGFLLFRVLAPALATILIAARAGAAVTADLGNRTYSRQLDALRSLGIDPARYHFTAVSFAFVIGTPLLCALVFVIATIVSAFVFVLQHHPNQSSFFWSVHFFRNFVDPATGVIYGLGWTIAKVLVAGFGIGAIAYHHGVSPKRSGAEVSFAITRTILIATLYVLLVHTLFAFVEF
jgi:ABC-type multidrug transport system ATPase subunit/ABC-type transporter Mla maintaining outer membrane lipid asymmetry permease subunit MlaE